MLSNQVENIKSPDVHYIWVGPINLKESTKRITHGPISLMEKNPINKLYFWCQRDSIASAKKMFDDLKLDKVKHIEIVCVEEFLDNFCINNSLGQSHGDPIKKLYQLFIERKIFVGAKDYLSMLILFDRGGYFIDTTTEFHKLIHQGLPPVDRFKAVIPGYFLDDKDVQFTLLPNSMDVWLMASPKYNEILHSTILTAIQNVPESLEKIKNENLPSFLMNVTVADELNNIMMNKIKFWTKKDVLENFFCFMLNDTKVFKIIKTAEWEIHKWHLRTWRTDKICLKEVESARNKFDYYPDVKDFHFKSVVELDSIVKKELLDLKVDDHLLFEEIEKIICIPMTEDHVRFIFSQIKILHKENFLSSENIKLIKNIVQDIQDRSRIEYLGEIMSAIISLHQAGVLSNDNHMLSKHNRDLIYFSLSKVIYAYETRYHTGFSAEEAISKTLQAYCDTLIAWKRDSELICDHIDDISFCSHAHGLAPMRYAREIAQLLQEYSPLLQDQQNKLAFLAYLHHELFAGFNEKIINNEKNKFAEKMNSYKKQEYQGQLFSNKKLMTLSPEKPMFFFICNLFGRFTDIGSEESGRNRLILLLSGLCQVNSKSLHHLFELMNEEKDKNIFFATLVFFHFFQASSLNNKGEEGNKKKLFSTSEEAVLAFKEFKKQLQLNPSLKIALIWMYRFILKKTQQHTALILEKLPELVTRYIVEVIWDPKDVKSKKKEPDTIYLVPSHEDSNKTKYFIYSYENNSWIDNIIDYSLNMNKVDSNNFINDAEYKNNIMPKVSFDLPLCQSPIMLLQCLYDKFSSISPDGLEYKINDSEEKAEIDESSNLALCMLFEQDENSCNLCEGALSPEISFERVQKFLDILYAQQKNQEKECYKSISYGGNFY